MFARLKPHALAPVAAVALWALILAFWPAVAEAQETPARANGPQAANRAAGAGHHVVVTPGDTLWSISEGRLGPGATQTQIARGVERIYALNQDLIGADPDTIYAGQRLALPRALGRHVPRQAPRQVHQQIRGSERAQPSPGADGREAAQTDRGAESGPERSAGPTAGKPAVGPTTEPTGRTASASEADRAPAIHSAIHENSTLPAQAVVSLVPAVRSLAAGGAPRQPASYLDAALAAVSSAASTLVGLVVTDERYAGRQLLGWALMATSLGIGAFSLAVAMARRRRERGEPAAGAEYAAGDSPSVGSANPPSQEDRAQTMMSAPSEGRERHEVSTVGPANGGVGPPRVYRNEDAGMPSSGRGPARRAEPRRMNRRRKVGGENPNAPGARRGFEIGDPLRRSLEHCPLRLGAPLDRVLAELRPQVEDELTYVELAGRSRRLSDRELSQAAALRDLLAVIREESTDGTRVRGRPPEARAR